jgi:magnesium-transporting ATPase (P-type)
LEEAAERNIIFAKLNPMQKAAVVRALKNRVFNSTFNIHF